MSRARSAENDWIDADFDGAALRTRLGRELAHGVEPRLDALHQAGASGISHEQFVLLLLEVAQAPLVVLGHLEVAGRGLRRDPGGLLGQLAVEERDLLGQRLLLQLRVLQFLQVLRALLDEDRALLGDRMQPNLPPCRRPAPSQGRAGAPSGPAAAHRATGYDWCGTRPRGAAGTRQAAGEASRSRPGDHSCAS